MNIYKELRKERNLTQSEMAKLIHVDQSTISKWEQDKAVPDVQTLNVLAKFFNVSIDFLLGRNEIDKPSLESTSQQKENTIILFGRGEGRKEYQMTTEEMKLLKTLIETMKNNPTDDNF